MQQRERQQWQESRHEKPNPACHCCEKLECLSWEEACVQWERLLAGRSALEMTNSASSCIFELRNSYEETITAELTQLRRMSRSEAQRLRGSRTTSFSPCDSDSHSRPSIQALSETGPCDRFDAIFFIVRSRSQFILILKFKSNKVSWTVRTVGCTFCDTAWSWSAALPKIAKCE